MTTSDAREPGRAGAAPGDPRGDVAAHLRFLEVERRLASRTLAMYGEAFARLESLAAEAQLGLRELRVEHVRRFAAKLHAEGLAPRTIAIALAAWRGLYRRLGEQGAIAANPVLGVRAPKAARPLPKALSVDDAVALAAFRRDGDVRPRGDRGLESRDVAIVELLYGSGLRVGELVGLDARAGGAARGWIDLDDATAHVLGKGDKRRSVPVGAAALAALRDWMAQRAAVAAEGEPALFVNARGRRLSSSQVRTRLAQRAVAAGVPARVHPHMLRHSFASHVLQSSQDLRAVQELLGHANIQTTQVYTKLDFGHLSKVYDAAHPRARKRAAK